MSVDPGRCIVEQCDSGSYCRSCEGEQESELELSSISVGAESMTGVMIE